jgi:hypothetical protein
MELLLNQKVSSNFKRQFVQLVLTPNIEMIN